MSLERLTQLFTELEPDAQDVLLLIAERLVHGRREHGTLRIDADPRDWAKEANEEFLDGSVYLAIATLRARRRTAPPRTAEQAIDSPGTGADR